MKLRTQRTRIPYWQWPTDEGYGWLTIAAMAVGALVMLAVLVRG